MTDNVSIPGRIEASATYECDVGTKDDRGYDYDDGWYGVITYNGVVIWRCPVPSVSEGGAIEEAEEHAVKMLTQLFRGVAY